MIDTVIFDLDGTLLDTLDDLAAAANAALQQRQLPTHSVEAYRQFIGRGVENLIRQAIGEQHPDVDQETKNCVALFREAYAQQWNVHSKPYAGVTTVLDRLADRGVRLAILSNKPHDFANQCAEHYFGDWNFRVVFGQRAGVPIKPDPTAVHEILRSLDTSADQCLYVGDSDVDMQTAQNAAVTACGACWGFRSREELGAAGANMLLDEPTDLLEYIG